MLIRPHSLHFSPKRSRSRRKLPVRSQPKPAVHSGSPAFFSQVNDREEEGAVRSTLR